MPRGRQGSRLAPRADRPQACEGLTVSENDLFISYGLSERSAMQRVNASHAALRGVGSRSEPTTLALARHHFPTNSSRYAKTAGVPPVWMNTTVSFLVQRPCLMSCMRPAIALAV